MPALNVLRPDAQPERPAFGLFSLNWLVPDAESSTRTRAAHRVQVGIDLSGMDVRAGRFFFRRNTPQPLSTAVRRWCWGHAALDALAMAIAERSHEDDTNSESLPTWPRDALRERLALASLSLRDRPLDPLMPEGAQLGEVQADLSASVLMPPSSSLLPYEPAFLATLHRASEAVRDEMVDLLTQHLDRSRVLFAQHHNDPSDLGAVQRLLSRAQTGVQPIVAPVETLTPSTMDERLLQDAQAVREVFSEPAVTPHPRRPASGA